MTATGVCIGMFAFGMLMMNRHCNDAPGQSRLVHWYNAGAGFMIIGLCGAIGSLL